MAYKWESEEQRDQTLALGRALEGKKAWILHESLAIGPVKRFWDGETEKFVSPLNELEVEAPVIELETGHSFVAKPGSFAELEPKEVKAYVFLQQTLAQVIRTAARGAASAGLEISDVITLLRAALRAQLAALEIPEKHQ
jgi:hypothetical protein